MSESTEFAPIAIEIAREAGALLMGFFARRIGYEYKGDADLVTEADRASEKLIADRIRTRWPRHGIVGEEGTQVDSGGEYRWYVDPLDGTTNFAHGFPVFCVSMGLEYKGKRVTGVVYDPTRDEMFSAEQGSGAYLNQRRIRVSATARFDGSLLATGFPSQKRHKNPNIHFYHQITLKTHGVRRAGSAALDLCYVAAGRVDGFWEFNLNPWDTAAGVLLVEEAGGKVSDFSDGPFQTASKETLASNGLIHADLLREFHAIFEGRGLEALASPVDYARSSNK
ncbi:MAG: inositol monophosphatase family protein [Candidatus Korobacteraceae bacterium]